MSLDGIMIIFGSFGWVICMVVTKVSTDNWFKFFNKVGVKVKNMCKVFDVGYFS